MPSKLVSIILAALLGLAFAGAPAFADDTKPADSGNAQASGDAGSGGTSGGGDQAKDDGQASGGGGLDPALDKALQDCATVMTAVGIVSMMKDCQNKGGD